MNSMRKIDKNTEFSYSLIEKFDRWVNSEKLYERFYSNCENPPLFDDFELQNKIEFYSTLFKIKPKKERENTHIQLGIAFEDALHNVMNNNFKIVEFEFKNNENQLFRGILNNDFQELRENRQKNVPKKQVEIKGVLENGLKYVGYADEVYSNCIIDVKTTSNFQKSNYDNSIQVALYVHFSDFPINRGFYQVTEFYRSKSVKTPNIFTQKDTFLIESNKLSGSEFSEFSRKCNEILSNITHFENDFMNNIEYFKI